MTSSWQTFCHGTPIWDFDLTWNNTWPEFTYCFEHTVLTLVPCGWLWITSPIYLYYLKCKSGGSRSRSFLMFSKLVTTVMLCLISLMDAAQVALVDGVTAAFWAPIIIIVTLLLSIYVMILEKKAGLVTSAVLFIFWTGLMLCSIIPFYSKIMHQEYQINMLGFVLFYFYFVFLLVQLVLQCFAEKQHHTYAYGKAVCPVAKASFSSRIVVWWLNDLMFLGYKKPVEAKDMWQLEPPHHCETLMAAFQRHWEHEETKPCDSSPYAHYSVLKGSDSLNNTLTFEDTNTLDLTDEMTPLIRAVSLKRTTAITPHRRRRCPLFKALLKTFGLDILLAQFWRLLGEAFVFANPMLLNLLIDFTEDLNQPQWKGYVFTAGFVLCAILTSLLFSQCVFQHSIIGMHMKTTIIASIYEKAMTIGSNKEIAMGDVVNLMSVDAQRVQDLMPFAWSLWSCPFEIALTVYYLYSTLGNAAFAGLSVLMLMIPVNACVAKILKHFQERQMKLKDKRIRLTNEVINGIKILKLYAWERSFEERIGEIRKQELRMLRTIYILGAVPSLGWTVAPFIVGLVTFSTYVYISGDHFLSAQDAFVSLVLLGILKFAINMMPLVLQESVKTYVSMKRINRYLNFDDLDDTVVSKDTRSGWCVLRASVSLGFMNCVVRGFFRTHSQRRVCDWSVSIQDGSFYYDDPENPCLDGINLDISAGLLVGVVGQVGAGKSSLISAILGELRKIKGKVILNGKVAYVPQEAWIQNATLRDNILFGKPMNTTKYYKVLDACALTPDLKLLPGGDKTEIGEKGVNLSGGQKQRVSLARAVYNDADIYLLDDPLSAVDAHVGKHIFENVIGDRGVLSSKTRVLVTHGIHWLPFIDYIVVLNKGRISEHGAYGDLLFQDGEFSRFLKQYLQESAGQTGDLSDDDFDDMRALLWEHITLASSEDLKTETDSEPELRLKVSESIRHGLPHRQFNRSRSRNRKASNRKQKGNANKLMSEEQTGTGRMKWSVVMAFARAFGVPFVPLVMSAFVFRQVSEVIANMWLTLWTEDPILNNRSLPSNSTVYMELNDYYIGLYGLLGVAQVVFVISFSITIVVRMVIASRRLHGNMLTNIMRCPMSFFDTTPIGRIINRFSLDLEIIDSRLPVILEIWLDTMPQVIGQLVVISYSTPIFLVVTVPLLVVYYFIQRFYVATSRQLKRMESTSRSPIFNYFGETMTGARVIRAYKAQDRFVRNMHDRINDNQTYYFAGIAANRWLSIRLAFLGNAAILSASLFAVLGRDTMTGGLVGLSVSYALQITNSLDTAVQMTSQLETNMVSVERVDEYTVVRREAAWANDDYKPPPSWPHTGVVEFKNYSLRYRPELDLVLKNISITIRDGEKVAIVGRTGAGKSSLTASLFRLIEPADGQIIIAGENVATLGLHDLRSNITILPQDPLLFSGSLRANLDPTNLYSDGQLWQALEHVHLKSFVQQLPSALLFECGEGGQNMSVGQRQLVCLARTLLRKTKVLVLDEATAAVDMETDRLIQATIRTEFANSTVITIAHRLNTIMDYDRVLVLEKGQVKEFDDPKNLLLDVNGLFYKMVRDAGLIL